MNAIRNVIVAGTGPMAWIAAAGLLRAFKHRALEVTVVDSGSTTDARSGRWLLPSQRGIHGLLGIAEPHFVHHTGATFRLATEHLGWQGDGSRFLHAHGDIGVPLSGGTPFYKYIQHETLSGGAERPEAYSLAGAAARLGKFARPMGEGGSLTASFTYGFHVEDAAYSNYLRAHALRQGVRAAVAPLAGPIPGSDGGIGGLRLADGSTISADYYIDCSGPEARLISNVATDGREDWSHWLPCDRMWSASGPPWREPAAVTQTIATAAGWQWRAPLAQASMVGQVFSSRFQDENAARAALAAFEPGIREPLLTRFAAGRRRRFWEHNCLALGATAVELEPLAGADLHLAMTGLATFIELFPRDRGSRIEAAEYNRVMAEHADALRDFTLAHYRVGAARGGEFWSAVRAQALPDRLAHKLDLYASSGRINLLDHEPFEEIDWAWLLMGSGQKPETLELQFRTQLARVPAGDVAALRSHVQQVAASMPPHMEFVRRQATLAARTPG
jgi:tryptophan 7-halogenase